MTEKILMKGNEAIAEAALRAGCGFYYGYPITPQTEIGEYLAREMPLRGGKFLQLFSEIAAINRVYGAAAAGARAMTSSSGPGISLKQEGISYLCAAELPCLVVNITRGGPGLGNIQPSQADYFQAVKGGGHGDYRTIVLAPDSVQEMADLTMLAFNLADTYRNPVILLADGALGQMMEPVEFKESAKTKFTPKNWALSGCKGRAPNRILPLGLDPVELEQLNLRLAKKYRMIEERETRFELVNMAKPELILVCYGFTARIAKAVIRQAKALGIEIGLIRPITLWPFPSRIIRELAQTTKKVLVVEMSQGQMVEDVERAVAGKANVSFYGRSGGMIPTAKEIMDKIQRILSARERK